MQTRRRAELKLWICGIAWSDGAAAPGGAFQGQSPARGAPDAVPRSGAALIKYGQIRQRNAVFAVLAVLACPRTIGLAQSR